MSGCKIKRLLVFVFWGTIAAASVVVPHHLWAGDINGTINAKKSGTKKVAQRYPGKHAQMSGKLEPIPPVIMLLGPVKNHPPPAPAPKQEIVQKDLKFQPALLVIPVNSTVDFPNHDPEFHNVFSYSKTKRFDLGRYPKGESKYVKFTKPGIGKIYCEIHQWMRAVIVVVENPFYTTAGEKGSYQIKNIPKGTYDVLFWKIGHKKAIKEIEVPANGTVEVNVTLPEEKSKKRR